MLERHSVDFRCRHVESSRPGELLNQDTFYWGTRPRPIRPFDRQGAGAPLRLTLRKSGATLDVAALE